MSDNKPKEFWVETKNMAAWDESQPAHRPTVRVIEYSAYEQLQKELDDEKQAFAVLRSANKINLQTITSLRESLKEAVEALNDYMDARCKADVDAILDKITSKHGGL